MKYRMVAGLIGASMIAAALSGCGKKGGEAEPETLAISDMEVVDEQELRSESELEAEPESSTVTGAEMESMELELIIDETELFTDASEEEVIEESELIIDEGTKTARLENRSGFVKKPGVEEAEETQTEPQTQRVTESETLKALESETAKQTEKAPQKTPKEDRKKTQTEGATKGQTENTAGISAASAPAAHTETTVGTGSKTESERTVGKLQTEDKAETEAKKPQTEAKAETEAKKPQTEAKTETEAKKPQTEAKAETEAKKPQTEAKTETEAKKPQTESETETEAQTESETETETGTEAKTESETESETEAVYEEGLRIIGSAVRVREQPNTDSAVIASLTAGMNVYAIGESGEWTQIYFESEAGLSEGFVMTEYLTDAANLYEAKEVINVRAQASSESDKLGMIATGERVLVLEKQKDGWTKIRYAGADESEEAYVLQEYLKKAEYDAPRLMELVEDKKKSAEEDKIQETESETESEAETEAEAETQSEGEPESEAEAEAETETEAKQLEMGVCTVTDIHVNVREQPSTEAEVKATLSDGMVVYAAGNDDGWTQIYYESADGVEDGYMKTEYLRKADSDDARIADLAKEKMQEAPVDEEEQTETEAPADTEADTAESGTPDSEADGQTDAGETETQTEETDAAPEETESDAESETESETDVEPTNTVLDLTDGAESQFKLLAALFPEAKKIGIIYSYENENAQTQTEEYEKFAEKYGVELALREISADLDIDLAASELVDSVDCIFGIDDPSIDELMDTVCAYADEMGIPVIGVKQTQVESGCLAAYEQDELHWNADKAVALGLSGEAPTVE